MLPIPHPLQLPYCKARVDKFALKLVFKVRRPSLPWVEGTFQSRIIRSGSGCLRSACNVVFSLASAGLRGTSCGKQSVSPANCVNWISEGFFATQMPFFDVSPPSPSQPAAPNMQGWAGEQLVPARSTQRGLAGTHPPDTSRLPARAGALFQLFPPGDLADLTQALACHFTAPGFCSQFLLSEVSSKGLGWERDAGGMLLCGAGRKRVSTALGEGLKVLRYPYKQEGLYLCITRIYLKRVKPAQRKLQM